ncbi:hypothetical protein C0J56_12135 [Pseudomonas fluorescens]|nr:hypothetical protein C0J56_12135 [Pseudomonas fluorescens]
MPRCRGGQQSPVGASLLAKTAVCSTFQSTDPPLSRASPLPQVQWCAQMSWWPAIPVGASLLAMAA